MHIFEMILGENSKNKSIIVLFRLREQLLITVTYFRPIKFLKIFYHGKNHP